MSSNTKVTTVKTPLVSLYDTPPSYNDSMSWYVPKQSSSVSPSSTHGNTPTVPGKQSQVQVQTMDRDITDKQTNRTRFCCGSSSSSSTRPCCGTYRGNTTQTMDTTTNCCDSILNCYILSLIFNGNQGGNNQDCNCCDCGGCCHDCDVKCDFCDCDCGNCFNCDCGNCDCGSCDCGGCDCGSCD